MKNDILSRYYMFVFINCEKYDFDSNCEEFCDDYHFMSNNEDKSLIFLCTRSKRFLKKALYNLKPIKTFEVTPYNMHLFLIDEQIDEVNRRYISLMYCCTHGLLDIDKIEWIEGNIYRDYDICKFGIEKSLNQDIEMKRILGLE